MNLISRAQEILDLEIEGLRRIRASLNHDFERAVELTIDALSHGSKIVVSGIGKNLHIAEKISATLASTGSTSVVLNPSQAMHGDLGILCRGDILLALSYSGESEEILELIPMVRRLGVKIVSFTGNNQSALGRLSDVTILVTVDREACPFNMAPTTSTTATLAMGDALAMVLLEARGFQREDYAKLHPGGAIGRALLLKVADIMRTGDQVAAVDHRATVKDAILEMSRARAGSAAVVDAHHCVVGIFTDGDLRRNLANRADVVTLPISAVMSANPIVVTAEQLAVDVLRVFEEHNIDDLIVVDAQRRLVGSVDIQDLPKLKIM